MEPVSVVRSRLESLLLVSDEPTSAVDFARVLETSEESVTDALQEIATEFSDRGMGFELRERDGLWRLYTRRENSATVEAKILDGSQQRLSRAALETLAVVAYRQPVTRSQVAGVRGVNCDGVMRTLALRGLIAEVGVTGEVGGAHLYATTDLFLEQLGIESLEALPNLAPLLPDVDAIDALD
ncbi:MAG: SMC-Scp complex subunit ScpB [Corynebacterium sp.]|uniref:SMC-Scp complex subunit ScpB n=1 Tax=unclassified Corynebacterium TaxID=2624378 RepID=UPI0026492F10|nr:SMC-Scp complex subunit ScpB [Corynebacterium sp.]MDN5582399.1 SMC-Scp complex subunit ScpB [Corynebacterium sp.]MDN5719628.1 SMC-Scp complex subunit ScpB [Corynebacterium sp.]MDN6325757.1 SMC-Scp complex subunit ScpB [Corynebacterium sp.]MDN6387336.1 SMC-Scp complex subunit ScpB [Corynebacterium sp.]MDN6511228.1 SMC-Scp complex subunit ScpB [Corynebacterium sp.]